MTQTIGIIGSGGIGGEVAKLAVEAGYDVIVSNSRGPESLADQVRELGANARAATVQEAAQASDIVIVAVPLKAYDRLPVEALKGKVVIDMMNYYPFRESKIPVLDSGELTSSEMVQRHLVGAKVIKALHNQDAPHLYINARPGTKQGRTTLPVAGDGAEAKATVTAFLDGIGYDAMDAGSLAESWRIEPGTPIYVWPYGPEVPAGLSGEEAEAFYVTTPGRPVSAAEAQELIAKAVRPDRIGGFPEDLPAVWVAVVGRHAEVAEKAERRG
jgi:predicted dinucleotide-binding enzyme